MVGAAPRSTTATVRRFILDWLFFAPMAILIALVVSLALGADVVSPQLRDGALITFGLSFFLAFYEDIPTRQWDGQSRRWKFLSVLLGILYVVVIALGLIGMTMVFSLRAMELAATPGLDLFVTALGAATVVIALLVGIGGVATRIKERTD
jgi:hypothetical protein